MRGYLRIGIVLLALAALAYGLWMGPLAGGQTKGEPQERARRSEERALPVEVAPVVTGTVEERLSYLGTLAAQSSVEIFAKVEGRLEGIYVDVGHRVKEGDPLARIERDEILQQVREAEAALEVAQATVQGMEAKMKNLERQLERAKKLLEKDFISRQELEGVETQLHTAKAEVELARAQVAQREAVLQNARLRLSNTEILSPMSGYVGRRFLDRGAMVKSNTPIVSVVNIERVKTVVSVVEKDYHKLKPGLPATVGVDAYPGRTFAGRIARISPVLDRDTRTAESEIEVSNPQSLLKPGMFARVTLTLARREARRLVPEAALVKKNDGVGVFKLDGDGSSVSFVPVEIGATQDGAVEVIHGVSPGDRVVTLGAHLLQDGARVRVVNSAGQ